MAAIPKVCLYRAFCGQKTERYWDLSSGSSHLTALEQKNLDYTVTIQMILALVSEFLAL